MHEFSAGVRRLVGRLASIFLPLLLLLIPFLPTPASQRSFLLELRPPPFLPFPLEARCRSLRVLPPSLSVIFPPLLRKIPFSHEPSTDFFDHFGRESYSPLPLFPLEAFSPPSRSFSFVRRLVSISFRYLSPCGLVKGFPLYKR